MGRSRTALPGGLSEAVRSYAQALRDIRDARGETQEQLGRLVGWSVPVVSRFEAGKEVPDAATHRRYCALAPTTELRERAANAFRGLTPGKEAKAPPGIRRSNEQWHARALDGPGLYRFLEETYPAYPALKMFEDDRRPLPVWAEVAPREQWEEIEAGLGELAVHGPVPDVRSWRWDEQCDPQAEADFRRHVNDWEQQVKEIQA